MNLLTAFREKYFLTVKDSALHGMGDPNNLEKLFKAVLNSNLHDIAEAGGIPASLHAQANAVIKHSMFLQISASRDATQPLRPCADMSEEEAFSLGSPGQVGDSKKRLLKLILSDGNLELPAIELMTHLSLFRSLPIPGEKVIVREGAAIKNGMLIIDPSTMSHLGGNVDSLKKEYEFRRQRHISSTTGKTNHNDTAPRFQPFAPGCEAMAAPTARLHTHAHASNPLDHSYARDGSHNRGGGLADSRVRGRGRGTETDGSRGSRGRGTHRGRGTERNRGAYRGQAQHRGGTNQGRGGTVNNTTPASQLERNPIANFLPAWNDNEDFPVLGDF